MSTNDSGRRQFRDREDPDDGLRRWARHTDDLAAKDQPRTVPFDQHRSSFGAAFAWGLVIGAVVGGIAVDLWLQWLQSVPK